VKETVNSAEGDVDGFGVFNAGLSVGGGAETPGGEAAREGEIVCEGEVVVVETAAVFDTVVVGEFPANSTQQMTTAAASATKTIDSVTTLDGVFLLLFIGLTR